VAIEKNKLQKLDRYRWLAPRSLRENMRTDALIYADEKLLEAILSDLSIEQAMNVACLPGIVGKSLAMPDIHQGYGFPIGGVAATNSRDGVISPGGVGFDINCGVRLLASNLDRETVRGKLRELVNQLFAMSLPAPALRVPFLSAMMISIAFSNLVRPGWLSTVTARPPTSNSARSQAKWTAPTLPKFPIAPSSAAARSSALSEAAITSLKCNTSSASSTPVSRKHLVW